MVIRLRANTVTIFLANLTLYNLYLSVTDLKCSKTASVQLANLSLVVINLHLHMLPVQHSSPNCDLLDRGLIQLLSSLV